MCNDQDFSSFLNGFSQNNSHQALKDRMKTVIMRAKQGNKDEFIRALATDYIRISKEL